MTLIEILIILFLIYRQSIASISSNSSGRSYVSAVRPSAFEILSWRMENHRKRSQHDKHDPSAYLERLPDVPPPLPPHPHRRSNQSTRTDISDKSSSRQSTNSVQSSVMSNEPLCSISYRIDRTHSFNKSYA